MRKKVYEIQEEEEKNQILRAAYIGRLATNGADGFPAIVPLNYVWWQGKIYVHCAREGEKITNIDVDSRVCFEVDEPLQYLGLAYDSERPTCHVTQFYRSVVIRGNAAIVDNAEEKRAALNRLMARHEGNMDFVPITAETEALNFCHIIGITPVSISGKANLGQKMSQEARQKAAEYFRKRGFPGDRKTAAFLLSQ